MHAHVSSLSKLMWLRFLAVASFEFEFAEYSFFEGDSDPRVCVVVTPSLERATIVNIRLFEKFEFTEFPATGILNCKNNYDNTHLCCVRTW